MKTIRSDVKFLFFKVKRNFLYAAFIGLVIWLYLFVVLSLLKLFSNNYDLYIITLSLSITFAAISFNGLEKKICQITDKVFFKKRTGYHQTITEMLKKMSVSSELSNLTKVILDTIYNEVKSEAMAFYLKSVDHNDYEIVNQYGWQNISGIPQDDPLLGALTKANTVLAKDKLIGFLVKRPAKKEQRFWYNALNQHHAEVVVPFMENSELLGFLLLGRKASGEPYFQDELDLLEAVGNQAVLGLKSSHLYEMSQNKVKELTTLFEVGRLMGSTLDIKEIFASIIKSVIQTIDVDRGLLFLYDETNSELYSVSGYGVSDADIQGITLQVGDSVLGRIFKKGEPVLVPSITRDTEYVRRLGVESYIVVPMKAKNKIIGLLTIDNAPSGRSLGNINMDLLMTLAGQMAIAIENAKLYDEAKEKVKELSELNKDISTLKNYNEDILKTMPSGLISFDKGGKVVTFNSMAAQISDWLPEEVIGKSRKAVFAQYPQLLEALSKECSNIEVVLSSVKQNRDIYLNINTRKLMSSNEEEVGLLSVITDISQIKILESQLRRSDRVSALGTMVAGVAHEIKNPLTSMKMFVQLMEVHKNDPSFWEEHGSIIVNEVDRLENIVEDFLGFARTPEVHIKPVCIAEITNKVYQLIKTQSRKENVDIELNVDETICINADTQKLMQVFLNLVLNAIQAMPAGRDIRGVVKLTAQKDNELNKAQIVVEDNGIGISPENLERLFTPFFTTKQKGTGLGLSIAHKIVIEHGGSMDVESELGSGTKFIVELPLAE